MSKEEGMEIGLFTYGNSLLLLFKTAKRKNYSIEAPNIQLQASHTLFPQQAVQVKWSYINTNNQVGKNI